MLNKREATTLLEILGNEDKPLETVAAAFQRAFVRADHFRVAAAICVMLDDNLMLQRHRVAALYIIQDLYKDSLPGVHPFMPFLVTMLTALKDIQLDDQPEHRLFSRNLLCLLLAQPPAKDLSKRTPAELMAAWQSGEEVPQLPNLVRRAHHGYPPSAAMAPGFTHARALPAGRSASELCRARGAGARAEAGWHQPARARSPAARPA